MAEKITILEIPINNMTMLEAVQEIVKHLYSDRPCRVFFVNADCVNLTYRDKEYLTLLQQAELCFADGIGMKIAGKLLGHPIKDNVNGTDLFPRLCEVLVGTGKKVFLLGARPGVAEKVRQWMQAHYPGINVVGCHHGYFTPDEEPGVITQITHSGADLLLVAMGAPLQEKWLSRHLAKTGAKVGMGVGGLFDFYSGRIPRAPLWMRKVGLEWLYRLWQEPRRLWKRYLIGNFIFLFRVFRKQRT